MPINSQSYITVDEFSRFKLPYYTLFLFPGGEIRYKSQIHNVFLLKDNHNIYTMADGQFNGPHAIILLQTVELVAGVPTLSPPNLTSLEFKTPILYDHQYYTPEVFQSPDHFVYAVMNDNVMTMGRHTSNQVCVRDAQVSKFHCQLSEIQDFAGSPTSISRKLLLLDHGSSNGTWYNGRKITRTAQLCHGMVVAVVIIICRRVFCHWSHSINRIIIISIMYRVRKSSKI